MPVSNQEIKKIVECLDNVFNTLSSVQHTLATLEPLVRSSPIVDGLNNTYAAHTLNLLTHTLLKQATLDLCKATLDKHRNSNSLHNVFRQIDVMYEELKSESIGTSRNKSNITVMPQEGSVTAFEYDSNFEDYVRNEFDKKISEAKSLFKKLQGSEVKTRLKKARDKWIAHTEILVADDSITMWNPQLVGLKWGDPAEFLISAQNIFSLLMSALYRRAFAFEMFHDEYKSYADDFWGYLTCGIRAKQKAKNGSVY